MISSATTSSVWRQPRCQPASIPRGVLTSFLHELGFAWLAALVEAPVAGPPIMGGADDGFVAQLSCGPRMSRYYLQCALSEDLADWPDQRIWDEIRLRLRDLTIVNDTVHDKELSRCGPWSTCRCSTAISFLPAMLRTSRLSRPPVRPRRGV